MKSLTARIEHETKHIELADGLIKSIFPTDVYDAYKAKLARIQTIAREANVQIQEIIEDREEDTKFALMSVKQGVFFIEGAKITIEVVRNTGK